MIIIPAIDLYQKKVVRLTKGDKSNCKVYSRDPVFFAKKWQQKGAKWIHLVDLSAAFSEGDNKDIIANIVSELNIPVEVGGGIRSLDRVEELISLGVERLIIGTKAIDPVFLKEALKIGGSKIAVAVDEVKGKLAIKGWQKNTDLPIMKYLDYLKEEGISWVIYTDTSRDGTLGGFNLNKIKEFSEASQFNLIFSGGVSSLEDIKKLKEIAPQAAGVIIGKALYEQKFSLEEAIACQ